MIDLRSRVGPLRLACAVAVVVAASCGNTGTRSPPPTGTAAAITTVDGAHARAEASAKAGGIYHATLTVTGKRGSTSTNAILEQWVDVDQGQAREQSTFSVPGQPGEQHETTLLDGTTRWFADGHTGTVLGCHGVSAAAGTIIGCDGPTDTSTIAEEQRGGKRVLVLTTTGTQSGGDAAPSSFTATSELDPESGLPIRRAMQTKSEGGQPASEVTTTYSHSFVSRSSLAKDFFDPASMGRQQGGALGYPADAPPYWLGATFAPGNGLPALKLADVKTNPHGPGYAALVVYGLADPPGTPLIMLQLFTTAAFDGAHIGFPGPCAGHPATATLGLAQATFHCSYGSVAAVARLKDGVVVVASMGDTTHPGAPGPYDSFEAISAVVSGLQVRTP